VRIPARHAGRCRSLQNSDDEPRRSAAGPSPQRAAVEVGQDGLQPVEGVGHRHVQVAATTRRLDPVRCPDEQWRPDRALQRPQLLAGSRLRQVPEPGAVRDRTRAVDGDEGAEPLAGCHKDSLCSTTVVLLCN